MADVPFFSLAREVLSSAKVPGDGRLQTQRRGLKWTEGEREPPPNAVRACSSADGRMEWKREFDTKKRRESRFECRSLLRRLSLSFSSLFPHFGR